MSVQTEETNAQDEVTHNVFYNNFISLGRAMRPLQYLLTSNNKWTRSKETAIKTLVVVFFFCSSNLYCKKEPKGYTTYKQTKRFYMWNPGNFGQRLPFITLTGARLVVLNDILRWDSITNVMIMTNPLIANNYGATVVAFKSLFFNLWTVLWE